LRAIDRTSRSRTRRNPYHRPPYLAGVGRSGFAASRRRPGRGGHTVSRPVVVRTSSVVDAVQCRPCHSGDVDATSPLLVRQAVVGVASPVDVVFRARPGPAYLLSSERCIVDDAVDVDAFVTVYDESRDRPPHGSSRSPA
ncbi:hypothetical protein GWI33_012231, partial [Rhynchophorus ferrugineus]